jgi:2',3'-cyclic-nucleotide 2'-phosphodiesterase (5'-nucleotidase family)
MTPSTLRTWLLWLAVSLSSLVAACQGCRNNKPNNGGEVAAIGKPAVRLYLMTTIAGSLDPCGCSKDQLGGLDHLAAFVKNDSGEAKASVALAAGPLFFLDPVLKKDHATQDRWKAESIADAMKAIGLVGWAPGFNDWAGGEEKLAELGKRSGAAILAAGMAGDGFSSRKIVDAGGLKVGVIGLSDPKGQLGRYPEGVKPPKDVKAVLASEVATAKKEGAQLIVVLATMPRGQALRLASTDGIHVLVIGQPSSKGEGNTEQSPAEMVEGVLVVETANHAQTVAVVDVYVRGDGELKLADAGGVSKAGKIADLSRRIRELETRINSWEKGGKVKPEDVAARKADLAKLRAQRTELEKPEDPPKGSFFRYRVQEVREKLGEDEAVVKEMRAYYKRVNEHNKKAFADLEPPKPSKGEAGYIGIEECTLCHAEAREVWDETSHAQAYDTLQKDFKEYNLECVGCHVTGYGKPGGSTVTHNEKLQDVQCEDCHGPGSLHAEDPENPDLIQLKPDPKTCVARCHHPPHVENFDPVAKMDLILGPGHGK